eukprot:tig00020562_g11165.t1
MLAFAVTAVASSSSRAPSSRSAATCVLRSEFAGASASGASSASFFAGEEARTFHAARSFVASSPGLPSFEVVCMGRRAAKIAARKGKADLLKGKLYSRVGKKIITAVKQGGPDPVANSALASILKEARNASVPTDIIDRNIKKASEANQAAFNEITYEFIGHGGVGILVEALTDNPNRANSEVRRVAQKAGGKIASPGSVSFNFSQKGAIRLSGVSVSEDAMFEAATEAGADDVFMEGEEEGSFTVLTAPGDLYAVKEALEAGLGIQISPETVNLEMIPNAVAEDLSDEDADANDAMIEALEELDDVNHVFHSMPRE